MPCIFNCSVKSSNTACQMWLFWCHRGDLASQGLESQRHSLIHSFIHSFLHCRSDWWLNVDARSIDASLDSIPAPALAPGAPGGCSLTGLPSFRRQAPKLRLHQPVPHPTVSYCTVHYMAVLHLGASIDPPLIFHSSILRASPAGSAVRPPPPMKLLARSVSDHHLLFVCANWQCKCESLYMVASAACVIPCFPCVDFPSSSSSLLHICIYVSSNSSGCVHLAFNQLIRGTIKWDG